jgi:hypothetical protein
MDSLAGAVWAHRRTFFEIGHVQMLGEFFLAVFAEENVLRHDGFSGQHHTPDCGAKAERPFRVGRPFDC